MGGVSKETVSAFGHKIKKSDLFKLVGLVCFIALVFGIVAALWPSLSLIFEPDGLDQMIESIQSQGPVGVLILLGLQLLQIIVAFIPGEVVQVAAGMLYGPLFGTLIILLGCVISSSLIYTLVHKLGAPFVRAMVDEKHLVKFYEFERSGKLNLIVFVLFLIPGMPKDVFTYLIPLTNMRMRAFLVFSTVRRYYFHVRCCRFGGGRHHHEPHHFRHCCRAHDPGHYLPRQDYVRIGHPACAS